MHKRLRKTDPKAAGPIKRSRRSQTEVNGANRNESGGFFLPSQRKGATSILQRNFIRTSESYLVGGSPVIQQQTCNRCGFQWYPRSQKPPKYCANKQCRSPYWNKERVRPIPRSKRQKKFRKGRAA